MTSYDSVKLAQTLTLAGIDAVPYKRNPLPGTNLIFNPGVSGKKIYVYADPENAEIDVRRSKRHTQAVIHAVEPRRKIVSNEKVQTWISSTSTFKTAQEDVLQRAKNTEAGVTIASKGVRRSYVIEERGLKEIKKALKTVGDGGFNNSYYNITVKATVIAPKTKITMLVGKDESRHFISALPERVHSVPEARELLRPNNVPKGSLRQGEFFFVPIELTREDMDYMFMRALNGKYKEVFNEGRWNVKLTKRRHRLESFSSHSASIKALFPKGHKYYNKTIVKGTIKDSRRGRHSTLHLDSWHEVIRNKEIVIPFEDDMKNRYWD